MIRRRHIAAHAMTVGGFGCAVWFVADLRIAAAGMLVCLSGIGWWVVEQCREESR
jgi:hypothetical protein